MCKHSTKNNNSPHGTSGNHNHNHKHNIAIHAVILRKAISCPELLSLDALVLGLLAVTSYCYVVRLSKHENSKALTLNASDIEPTEAVLATVSKSTIPAVSFANLWMVNHIAQQVVECHQSQTISKILEKRCRWYMRKAEDALLLYTKMMREASYERSIISYFCAISMAHNGAMSWNRLQVLQVRPVGGHVANTWSSKKFLWFFLKKNIQDWRSRKKCWPIVLLDC